MNHRNIAMALAAALLVPGAAAAQQLDITGTLRPRYEWIRTPFDRDAFTTMRTRVALTATPGPAVRVFVQLQDARIFGEEGGTQDPSADGLDLHQGYLELAGEVLGLSAVARLGRQMMALGNQRLVGERRWSYIGQSFDGARLIVRRADAWEATLFGMTISERGRRRPWVADIGDQVFLGAHVDAGPGSVYVLQDLGAAYRVHTEVDRTTFGGLLRAPVGLGFEASIEGAYQIGTQLGPSDPVRQDIFAYYFGGRLTRGVPGPVDTLELGLDWLSGDEDPGDAEHLAFEPFFGARHRFYGSLDFFNDPQGRLGTRGLVDLIIAADTRLPGAHRLRTEVHGFFTAVRRPLEAEDIGWELDLVLPARLADALQAEAGYSLFFNRASSAYFGLGPEEELTHWFYLMATASF